MLRGSATNFYMSHIATGRWPFLGLREMIDRFLRNQRYSRIPETRGFPDTPGTPDAAHFVAEGLKDNEDGPIASNPSLFEIICPLQFWAGRLVTRVNKFGGVLDDAWLPKFSTGSASLRKTFAVLNLKPEDGSFSRRGLLNFALQLEVGGMVMMGVFLEFFSAGLSLLAPWILRKLLIEPRSAPLAVALVTITVLSTVLGRARDQVSRTHGTWTECLLQSAIFTKALHLSPSARIKHPPAQIINLSSVDVLFLSHYVAHLHDFWSAPLQILAVGGLATGIMGWPALAGVATMAGLFVIQGRASIRMGDGVREYISLNDTRLAGFRDLLNNFKAVKALAVEPIYHQLISKARTSQLKPLQRYLSAAFSLFTAVNQTAPALVASTAFVTYWLTGGELTAEIVFPTLAYYNLLYQPVYQASLAISRHYSAKPCLERLLEFLFADESEGLKLLEVPNPAPLLKEDECHKSWDDNFSHHHSPIAVEFHNARMRYSSTAETGDSEGGGLHGESGKTTNEKKRNSWTQTTPKLHRNLWIGDLQIPKGSLTTVIGPTGSGKSSLLLSILGELSHLTGGHNVCGKIAYSSQEPFILSGSFQDNITFGQKNETSSHAEKFYHVLTRTGLDIDLDNCPGGMENAVIGESGSNLSGGQKSRVGLARSLYSDADLLLLDDPLAAVDAKVKNKLFEAIRQETRTVVLATLHTHYAIESDYIIVVDDNEVVWSGDRECFIANKDLCLRYLHQGSTLDKKRQDHRSLDQQDLAASPRESLQNHSSNSDTTVSSSASHEEAIGLVEQEDRATGAMKWKVLTFYLGAAGGKLQVVSVLALLVLSMGVRVILQYWFVWWIENSFGLSQSTYMGVYLVLVLAQSVLIAALGLTLVAGSIRASRVIHDKIVQNILDAPLHYFQSQPTGRVLTRLSADVDAIDKSVMNALDALLNATTTLLSSLVLIAITGPFMFVAVVPFVVLIGFYLRKFRVCAREVQRSATLLKSPIISVLSEALSAPATIRAYADTAVPYLQKKHDQALDLFTAATLVRRSLDTWITLRAEMSAVLVLAAVAACTVLGIIPEIKAGLALGVATTLAKNVYLLAWSATDIEIQMNSAERLMVYHDEIPRERPERGDDSEKGTPFHLNSGAANELMLKDVSVRYRSRAGPVLEGVNLIIPAGQRVGIVGRTGSGKSTLLSTLSRLVDPTTGSISLSGVDISTIPPRKLRRIVHTLPQEPLIFQGTLRQNLDPESKHSDDELISILEVVQLRDVLEARFLSRLNNLQETWSSEPSSASPDIAFTSGELTPSLSDPDPTESGLEVLDQELASGGPELSTGQRQLLCAARVLLAKPPVLLVDEAAANIDFASDAILQRSLRELLPPTTTMIVIAHRAASLAWMDRIIALRSGRVVEDDPPLNLLERYLDRRSSSGHGRVEEGYYASMVAEDGNEAVWVAVEAVRAARESRQAGRM